MIGHSLKNIFDSLGFAYDVAFCQNTGSLNIFKNVLWKKSFKNANRYQSFFFGGGFPRNINKNGGPMGAILRIFRSSRKLRYEK